MAIACVRCATPLVKRKDDSEDVFTRRLRVYEEETVPLIPLLEQRNLLIRVDVTSEDPAQVSHALLQELVHFHEPNLNALDAYRWLQFHEQSKRFAQDTSYRATIAKQYVEKVFFFSFFPPIASPRLTSPCLPSPDLLSPHLLSPHLLPFLGVVTKFYLQALYENRFHRSGILRRFIFLQTSERRKYLEHLSIFERFYGIEVLQVFHFNSLLIYIYICICFAVTKIVTFFIFVLFA